MTRNTEKTPSSKARARLGKISRLSESIREEINRRLADGHSGAAILSWLNSLPEVIETCRAYPAMGGHVPVCEISPENLSIWRSTGFREWRRERQDLPSADIMPLLRRILAAVERLGEQGVLLGVL